MERSQHRACIQTVFAEEGRASVDLLSLPTRVIPDPHTPLHTSTHTLPENRGPPEGSSQLPSPPPTTRCNDSLTQAWPWGGQGSLSSWGCSLALLAGRRRPRFQCCLRGPLKGVCLQHDCSHSFTEVQSHSVTSPTVTVRSFPFHHTYTAVQPSPLPSFRRPLSPQKSSPCLNAVNPCFRPSPGRH